MLLKIFRSFDNKIYRIIKIEEKIIFPYIDHYLEKDGPLLAMYYTYDIIKSEFETTKFHLSNGNQGFPVDTKNP